MTDPQGLIEAALRLEAAAKLLRDAAADGSVIDRIESHDAAQALIEQAWVWTIEEQG